MYFVMLIVLSALLSSFMLLLAAKWGIIEWMQTHGTPLLAELAQCCFCLSFWTNVLPATVMAVFTGDVALLALPLFATPITRMLL